MRLLLLGCTAMLAASQACAGTRFRIERLRYPDAAVSSTWVNSVNNRGEAVGGYTLAGSQEPHAFLYRNGRFTALAPGATASVATDLNDAGGIVLQVAGTPQSSWTGEVWERGKVTPIGDAPGCFLTLPSFIDKAGRIGGSTVCGSAAIFLLTSGSYQTRGFYSLDTPTLRGMNDRDQIVGSFDDGLHEGAQGFVWTAASFIELGWSPAPYDVIAAAVDDHGTVVGTFLSGTDYTQHGFTQHERADGRAGAWTQIDYPGRANTQLLAVSAGGGIVGNVPASGQEPDIAFALENGTFSTIVAGRNAVPAAVSRSGIVAGSIDGGYGFLAWPVQVP